MKGSHKNNKSSALKRYGLPLAWLAFAATAPQSALAATCPGLAADTLIQDTLAIECPGGAANCKQDAGPLTNCMLNGIDPPLNLRHAKGRGTGGSSKGADAAGSMMGRFCAPDFGATEDGTNCPVPPVHVPRVKAISQTYNPGTITLGSILKESVSNTPCPTGSSFSILSTFNIGGVNINLPGVIGNVLNQAIGVLATVCPTDMGGVPQLAKQLQQKLQQQEQQIASQLQNLNQVQAASTLWKTVDDAFNNVPAGHEFQDVFLPVGSTIDIPTAANGNSPITLPNGGTIPGVGNQPVTIGAGQTVGGLTVSGTLTAGSNGSLTGTGTISAGGKTVTVPVSTPPVIR